MNGENASVLSGSPQLSTSAAPNSPAGAYPITASAGTLAAANYSFAFVDGTLTINPATPIAVVTCPSVVYDGNPHACTAAATGIGGVPVNGSFMITYNGAPAAPSSAGTYAVSASFTSADPNYFSVTGASSLTISAAVLTVQADNEQMTFGSAVPALTYSATGFKGTDTLAVLSGSPQLNTGATSSSPAGSYSIVISLGTLAAANYTFAFVNGAITVNPAAPLVNVACPAVVFDGAPHACQAAASGVGGTVVSGTFILTYNGSPAPPSAAGTYSVAAAFASADPNYTNATGASSLTISRATPMVTVVCPAGVVHDGHRHGCTATVTGAGGVAVAGTLVITYNGSLRAPSKVGVYAVTATFTSSGPNYTNAAGTGSLTIQRRHERDDDGDDDDDDF